jgi:flagellar assembly protein FliH
VGHVVKGFGHVVPKAMLDAHAEAVALVAGARAEAEAIRGEAAAVREAARQEGLEAGLEAGRADGLSEAVATLAAARLEATRLVDAAAGSAIALAAKMAEKIVGRAVALSPEVMAEIVGEALRACRPGPGLLRFRLHPDDLAAVETRRAALATRAPAAAAFELLADETVGRFGCVIETPHGRIDARLESQLSALERALTGGVRGG